MQKKLQEEKEIKAKYIAGIKESSPDLEGGKMVFPLEKVVDPKTIR